MSNILEIKLLVLDNELDSMSNVLSKGFGAFSRDARPRLSGIAPAIVDLPVLVDLPASRWTIVANREEEQTAGAILKRIARGDFDGPFDGVIVDDNWSEDNSSLAGQNEILPALMDREKLCANGCRFLIISRHFGELDRVSGAFGLANNAGRNPVDVCSKEERISLGGWLREVIAHKAKKRNTPRPFPSKTPTKRNVVSLAVRPDGTVLFDGQIYKQRAQEALIAYLVFIALRVRFGPMRQDLFAAYEEWLRGTKQPEPAQLQSLRSMLIAKKLTTEDFGHAVFDLKKEIERVLPADRRRELKQVFKEQNKAAPGNLSAFIEVKLIEAPAP